MYKKKREAPIKTHIVRGDRVRVISGKEKGKEGRVAQVSREKRRVIVEGLNLLKHAVRPSQKVPKGGILEKEGLIAISNVMLVCGHCNKPVRMRIQVLPEGKKLRICVHCGEAIGAER